MTAQKLIVAALALLAAALIGAGAISWLYWSPRLELAETRATRAEADAERDRKVANDTADKIESQNAALDELTAKLAQAEEDARQARKDAQEKRGHTDIEAQQTLAETDPPGASVLEAVHAAQAAFDAELARERAR